MDAFYQVQQVNDHLIALKSLSGEFVYLVLGSECALLIDTCLGLGNLRATVESLTDLPIEVALTHGHLDHAMGAPEWEGVWMSPADQAIYKSMCDAEGRLGYLSANAGAAAADTWKDTLVPPCPGYAFRPLADGQVFDLGGITVEAIAFPGHTPGTHAFLLREDRILISGDACNNSTFLFESTCSTVEEYRRTVLAVQERLAGRYDHVFIQHHEMEVAPDLLPNMAEVCDRVLARDVDDEPFSFRGMPACVALAHDPYFHRLDGKSGNLIYNPNRLR